MQNFEDWIVVQEKLNNLKNFPHPKRRQIWWCVIGLNVGSEQSCSEGFERPVLVLKVFGSMFWGLPITNSDPEGKKLTNPLFYKIDGISYKTSSDREKTLEGYIALHQLRVFDSRRLKRKILRLDIKLFSIIKKEVQNLL